MAFSKYSDMLQDVLPTLKADPSQPMTLYAIKRSVIEFCAGSWIWKVVGDPIDVTAYNGAYDLEPPNGCDISAVTAVTYCGMPLEARTVEWLNQHVPDWTTYPRRPRFYTQVDTEQVILAPTPDENHTGALVVTMALQPSHLSTTFPRWIYNQYIYDLAIGAMARLMMMTNKPWGDAKEGLDLRAQFDAAIANARASSMAALGSAPVRATSQH